MRTHRRTIFSGLACFGILTFGIVTACHSQQGAATDANGGEGGPAGSSGATSSGSSGATSGGSSGATSGGPGPVGQPPGATGPIVPGKPLVFSDEGASSNLNSILSGIDWLFDVTMDDLDGDGHLDVLLGNHKVTSRLAINNGNGTFTALTLPTSTAQVWSQMMVDYDNDGQRDISLNWDTADFPVFHATGNRQFAVVSADQSYKSSANGMAWSDWNGDGRIDYMTGGFFGESLYKNTGSGFAAATEVTTIPAAKSQASLFFADLSGDGLPDLILQPTDAASGGGPGGIFTGTVKHTTNILVNKGSGQGLAAPVTGGLDALPGPGVGFGDIDNDGDLDVIGIGSSPTAGRDHFQVRLFRNDGGMHFTDITAGSGLPETDGTVNVYEVIYLESAIADFDNDGLQDIVWGEPTKTRLFHNLGSGKFAEVNSFPSHSEGRPSRIFTGDYNEDGTLDLLVGWSANTDQLLSLFKNTGTSPDWLGVKLVGSTIKLAVNSRIWVYEAGHLGDPNSLRGYREVLLSHNFCQPLVQHFGLKSTSQYDIRASFYPSGKTVDRPGVTPGQTITISEP
jgi:hypothetical protein